MKTFTVVVQPRHVHLSPEDFSILFGPDAELTCWRPIGHLGQFICQETVSLAGTKGLIESVRIIGPLRQQSQVELSEVEAAAAGLDAPLRLSGDSQNAGACRLLGPKGECKVDNVIVPARHLHLSEHLAGELGLRHHQRVRLVLREYPEQSIREVVVRIHPTFAPELHLTDAEAAAFWLQTGDQVHLA